MRIITSTRLVRAVRSRRLIFLLAMIVCLLSIADWRLPIADYYEPTQRVSAAPHEQTSGADGRSGHRTVILNESAQRKLLKRAPMEFTHASAESQVVMTLPMPDGTITRFHVEESPVMAAQLAARFPDTKTYRGRWS